MMMIKEREIHPVGGLVMYTHTVHCTLEVCIVHVNTMLHFIPYKAVATTTTTTNNSNNNNSGEPGRFEGSFVIIISVSCSHHEMICR